MKMSIIINHIEGEPAMEIQSTEEEGVVEVHVCEDLHFATVKIEDLKMALRKLSAK